MADGYRRGGVYVRGGRTHYRRGARIRPAHVVGGVAVGVVGVAWLTGAGTAGMSWLLPVAGIALVGVVAYRYRRPLGRVLRRATVWAGRRYARRNHATMVVAYAPQVVAAARQVHAVATSPKAPTRARRPHQPSLDV